ncbi:MAG: hypothetical protein NC908_05530, partial [Candidatus Omnitrophica bacterium]|nr:hypothetical protein [Candidatus Omnitrophota bacterium]
VIFPLALEFKPEIIIRYGGSDPHYLDELANLGLTLDGFRMIGQKVNVLSQQVSQGKCIDLLLSGYNSDILVFAWSALLSGLLDLDIDLNDAKENLAPPSDTHLSETKDIIVQLKRHLKKYWRCMGN